MPRNFTMLAVSGLVGTLIALATLSVLNDTSQFLRDNT